VNLFSPATFVSRRHVIFGHDLMEADVITLLGLMAPERHQYKVALLSILVAAEVASNKTTHPAIHFKFFGDSVLRIDRYNTIQWPPGFYLPIPPPGSAMIHRCYPQQAPDAHFLCFANALAETGY
jgi:hypothetical protein